MKTLYVFDCDGTLTLPRQKMDPDFANYFGAWGEKNAFCIVSGSDLKKVQEQIPEHILVSAYRIYTCAGNEAWEYARAKKPSGAYQSHNSFVANNVYSNPLNVSKALEEYLLFELKYSNWGGPKYDTHFEYRTGLLNFSIVGREAPQEVRDAYESFSVLDGDRHRICNYIREKFPEYEASVGGAISLDITNKGSNKAQILNNLNLTEYYISFFGDKCEFGGNDYPLKMRIEELGCGETNVVRSYLELIDKLNLKCGDLIEENSRSI